MKNLLVLSLMFVASCGFWNPPRIPYIPTSSAVIVEAEDYSDIRSNSAKNRNWTMVTHDGETAMKVLPDTRITEEDPFLPGTFYDNGKGGAEIDYIVDLQQGAYVVWGRAFSTGTEDNGVHVGINGTLLNAGKKIQWCGRDEWIWSSAKRDSGGGGSCGIDGTITIYASTTGTHVITFYQREDGFELDKFSLEPVQ